MCLHSQPPSLVATACGYEGHMGGGVRAATLLPLATAGAAALGMVLPLLLNGSQNLMHDFESRYSTQFGTGSH